MDDGETIEANGGLVGYLEHIALVHPQSFVPLLAKTLPLTVNGSVDLDHKAEIEARAQRFTDKMRELIARQHSDDEDAGSSGQSH